MFIDHIIVHRIQKEREGPSTLHLRDRELEVTPAAKHLLGGIHETYEKKTGKAYGTFQSNVETFPFSGYLDRFLGGTGGDFTSFTQRSMRRFKLEIDKADWATGGYVVFILYDNSRPEGQEAPDVGQKAEEEPGPHLIVVMLNDRRGTAVNPDTLEIRDITHLVLEELHLAVRIDIGSWQADEARYLSFVKGRRSGATVSRYFRDFVGCDEFVDPVSQSRLLVRASRQFVEHEKLSKEAALEIRRTIYEAAVEAHENAQELDLVEISKRLDPEHPEKLLRFVNSEKVRLSSRFEPDLGVLVRLHRYSGRDQFVSISFDAGVLGSRVLYEPSDRSLKIVSLPKSLERQLEKTL